MGQAEVLRLLIYILDAVNISAIAGVIVLHYGAYRRTPKGDNRLMPVHVIAISIAHIMFIILGTGSALTNGAVNPFAWQTILFVVASCITTLALFLVGEFQRRRIVGSK